MVDPDGPQPQLQTGRKHTILLSLVAFAVIAVAGVACVLTSPVQDGVEFQSLGFGYKGAANHVSGFADQLSGTLAFDQDGNLEGVKMHSGAGLAPKPLNKLAEDSARFQRSRGHRRRERRHRRRDRRRDRRRGRRSSRRRPRRHRRHARRSSLASRRGSRDSRRHSDRRRERSSRARRSSRRERRGRGRRERRSSRRHALRHKPKTVQSTLKSAFEHASDLAYITGIAPPPAHKAHRRKRGHHRRSERRRHRDSRRRPRRGRRVRRDRRRHARRMELADHLRSHQVRREHLGRGEPGLDSASAHAERIVEGIARHGDHSYGGGGKSGVGLSEYNPSLLDGR